MINRIKIAKKLFSKEIFSMMLVLVLFVGAAILMQKYGDALQSVRAFSGIQGIFLYVGVTIVAVVVAPISTLPLLPLAVLLWGSFWAAVLSIVGWSIGAAIAFWLARLYGKPLVMRIMPLERIENIEKLIPKRNIFLSIIVLRTLIPVDALSYALGLFSSVSFKLYLLATVIGVTPFAFVYAYAATLGR